MKKQSEMVLSIVAGAISGALLLGLVGRFVSAGVALITGSPLNLSWKGLWGVMVIGLVVGAVGGALYFLFLAFLKGSKLIMGVVSGLIMYAGFTAFAIISGKMILEVSLKNQLFLLVLVLVIFLLYGLVLSRLLALLGQRWGG